LYLLAPLLGLLRPAGCAVPVMINWSNNDKIKFN
jgi:hypothetical protein